jgi:hypothetical protein
VAVGCRLLREACGAVVRVTVALGVLLAFGFVACGLRDGEIVAVGVGAGAASTASCRALEATGISVNTSAADMHDNGLRVTRDPHFGDIPVRRSSQAIQTLREW